MKKGLTFVLCVFLFLTSIGCIALSAYKVSEYFRKKQAGNAEKIQTTAIRSYSEMSDGIWECNGYIYKYRLEITGRMPNAVNDSTYVYLSNLEEITFEQAWKASGLCSNRNDYFEVADAVLVEVKAE